MKRTIKKLTILLSVVVLGTLSGLSLLYAWNGLQSQPGDKMTSIKWNELVSKVDSLTHSSPEYMFKANAGTSYISINGAMSIPFSVEEYDIGNIYNPSNYTVTIPKTGTYEFCTNILGNVGNTYLHYLLYINGENYYPMGYHRNIGQREDLSRCYVKNFNYGDSITIKSYLEDSGTLHSGYRTTFYGRIIK